MENLTVDSVYGLGLFEAARDKNVIDEVLENLDFVKQCFCEYPELYELLRNSGVDGIERKRIVSEIFGDKIAEESLNFIYVLIDKRRLGSFRGILSRFKQHVYENGGISAGLVVTATPLSKHRREQLEKETGYLLRKTVHLETKVDKSLLGGCRIYIDGKLIDASLKTKLDELKEIMQ